MENSRRLYVFFYDQVCHIPTNYVHSNFLTQLCADSLKRKVIVKILFMAPRMVYRSIINLLWSLMSKMSMTFQSVSYGPCSHTGVTCVAADFGGII